MPVGVLLIPGSLDSEQGCGGGEMCCWRHHRGSLVCERPWGPAVGLGSRRGARPTWAELAGHGTRAVGEGIRFQIQAAGSMLVPSGAVKWGREVTLGEPGLRQGVGWAAGLPGKPQLGCSAGCFGAALARVPGAWRFPGPWCPCEGSAAPWCGGRAAPGG